MRSQNKPAPQLLCIVICDDDLQAVPTSNGTSFDFVTTENGPVCLDLYSTPQYKLDQPSDVKGELCAACVFSLNALEKIQLDDVNIYNRYIILI